MARPPRKDPPILVVIVGVFVVVSIIGFIWMNKLIVKNSFSFLSGLDLATVSGGATAAGFAAFVLIALYYINYPEGQLARDASAGFTKKES